MTITPESKGNSTPLRGVAWLRVVMTAALWLTAIGPIAVGLVWLPKGEFSTIAGQFMVFFVGLPLLIVSVVSTMIARALFRNSGGGIKAAIIFDAIVLVPFAVWLIVLISSIFDRNIDPVGRLRIGWLAAPFALLAGVEAIWLLDLCRCVNRSERTKL
jgi:hypothetical protein